MDLTADRTAATLFELGIAIALIGVPLLVASNRRRIGGNPASSFRRYWFPWSDFNGREKAIGFAIEATFFAFMIAALMR